MNRLFLLCAGALLPLAASAADLRLDIANGPAEPSVLHIALFDSADAFNESKALASQTAAMQDGKAQVLFANLPPGRYAVRAFADANNNGKLDTNMLGIPTERYGFSNDAKGMMGPPGFDAAALVVDSANVQSTLQLR